MTPMITTRVPTAEEWAQASAWAATPTVIAPRPWPAAVDHDRQWMAALLAGADYLGIGGLTELGLQPGVARLVLVLDPVYREQSAWIAHGLVALCTEAFTRLPIDRVTWSCACPLTPRVDNHQQVQRPFAPWLQAYITAVDQVGRAHPLQAQDRKLRLQAYGWHLEGQSIIWTIDRRPTYTVAQRDALRAQRSHLLAQNGELLVVDGLGHVHTRRTPTDEERLALRPPVVPPEARR